MTKRFLLALSLMAAAGPALTLAQTASPPAPRAGDVGAADSIVAALYDVISGPAGQARNWDRFRSLFATGARLIPTGKRPDGTHVMRVLTPDEYIAASAPSLEKNGFFEREIAQTSERYGDMVHRFSSYESRRTATDSVPFARGINSIQLSYDGLRWWVLTVLWEGERPDNPLPARYLGRPRP